MTTAAFLSFLFVSSVHAASDASSGQLTSMATVEAMQQVFSRSEKAHSESMAAIMQSMSSQKAWRVLEKNNLTTPALIEVTRDLRTTNLRKAKPEDPKKGYSGVDGARKLLNDMIEESMEKYDKEIATCTAYYSSQCAAMEGCRGQIAASNYIAANSRSLILDAQSTINRCEVDIPTRKLELLQHNAQCKVELKHMQDRLAIILADIAVMTTILEMTDCDAKKSLVEIKKLTLLRCEDPCAKGKSFVTFNHDGLKQQVAQLQSSSARDLMKDTFADMFEGVEGLESMEFVQIESEVAPVINKTQFNNPPVPRTKVPGNPCNDKNGGAPSAADKRAAKCTIGPSPQCYKLQERFLLIQSGIKDERDDLLEYIASVEKHCEETKVTLETQITNDEDMLSNAQTKLGFATEKEATAGETARQTAAENEQLEQGLIKTMKTCSDNYINYETELCALKKIRGELYKIKGNDYSGFFQDCEVGKWDPEECSKTCHRKNEQKGEQKLIRNVLVHPNGGAKCLLLAAVRQCNLQPCPVDCKVSTWSGWSKCSAACGGGVQQRVREVELAMKYGGKPCGETSQTQVCDGQSCEKDCVLSPWTKWSGCSKDCDGGTRKRQKFVKEVAEGAGSCAKKWDSKRLQYKSCAMKRCQAPLGKEVMTCDKKLDIVFLLDGSGSLGRAGWKAEIKAAQMFVDAFSGSGAQANMGVILYSGPRTWGGVRKCFGRNKKKVDMAKTCKIKTITHFTSDMKKVKKLITGLAWPQGSTLTSLALMTAKAELSLGRKDARSVVVVITDGRPLSYRATGIASRLLRKAARLVWVPVTKYAPLAKIKAWATRRWKENVVKVSSFKDLEKPDPVNHVIANICPATSTKVVFGRR